MRVLISLGLWLVALLGALGLIVIYKDGTAMLVVVGLGLMIALSTLNDLTKKDRYDR